MLDPRRVVLRLVVDPELRTLPLKYLAGKEEDADFPHILIADNRPFTQPLSWFQALLDGFEDQVERHGPELEASGVRIGRPKPDLVPGMRSP